MVHNNDIARSRTGPMLGDDRVNTRPSSVDTNGDKTPHRHNERWRKRRQAPPSEARAGTLNHIRPAAAVQSSSKEPDID